MLFLDRFKRSREDRGLPNGTYVELVRSLFATLIPTLIMAASFVGVGIAVSDRVRDTPLTMLVALGGIAAGARVATILVFRRDSMNPALELLAAERMERWFGAAYLSFAAIFGAFAARALIVAPHDVLVLVMPLVFGYGAGVAAGVSLRPTIAIPSILLASLPSIAAASLSSYLMLRLTGLLLAVFFAGAINSMVGRWRLAVKDVTMRRLFGEMARHDPLTGLDNRLSLGEGFDAAITEARGSFIAVHCLDLDRFKPVNDTYGHPVGDALLRAVADRLQSMLRGTDAAVRVGGDEFILLQTQLSHEGEAETLAHRVIRTIGQPFRIEGHRLSVGTSVGFALYPRDGTDLEQLIGCADSALYTAKRKGGGVAGWSAPVSRVEKKRSA